MSMFSNIGVTQQGIELLAKVHAGQAELKFTKIVMGSGEMPLGKYPRDMTELVTPILDLPIARLQSHEKTATVWGTMNSGDVREDFLFREKGLYAADPDHAEGEILYMYGNAGDMAPHIPSGSGGVVETNVGFVIYIGEAEVTAVLASGIYALEADLQAHINDEDLHGGGAVADALDEHISDEEAHVSEEDRLRWDNPPSGAPLNHNHTISQVTNLQSTLDGKAPSSHNHTATQLPSATTSAKGIVQLNNSLTSTSTTEALTAAQGKVLYDELQAPTVLAIGYNASAGSYGAVAISDGTVASNWSVAIGPSATATGNGWSVAIGRQAKAYSSDPTYTNGSSAFGFDAKALARNSTAIGIGSEIPETSVATMQLGSPNISAYLSALKCRVGLTVTSDIRDKTDITEIPQDKSLDFINRLTPIQYVDNNRLFYLPEKERTEEAEQELLGYYGLCDCYDKEAYQAGTMKGERKRVGLSAQEIQKALAEVYGSADYANIVNDNLHDITHGIEAGVENQLGVTYQNLIPFLIGAIQAQSKQIQSLSDRLTALEE